ncbi:rCG56494, isoform CRA_c [Rattus norvegicus]|uniref:RCG56494, isoform CRA_c n=1 Tax=Rattus norvegicus TaxID=10116 RepID=A6IBM9_RAT|nr:rCG56494, isoform CRA_c [Rattus norvegicus]
MDRDTSEDSMADLSFEAESPVMPPDELLEGLPSFDWLLQGRGRQVFFPPLEALGRSQEPTCWSSVLGHSRVPVVTEEVAREALLSFVNSQCCYSSAAAGDFIIQELRQQTLCRYRLETFSESRVSEWTFQPVTNHSVDGPQRGTSPRLWDMKVQVPPMFQEDTRKFQVPHSSLVKECHKCHGRGRYKCSGCHGAGMGGLGPASGSQQLRLDVFTGEVFVLQWHQAQSQAAPEMPHVLWLWPTKVQYVLWEGQQDMCHLQGGEKAGALCPAGHRVRQTIELIPITEVHYWYQGKTSVYYIYGTDHQVYVADYPERYCCGCTIL